MPTYFNYIKAISLFTLLLCFGGLFPALSQQQQIDSLTLLLKSARDTTRFNILAQLFRETNRSDYEAALMYAEQAYREAEALGDSARIVEGGRMMAYTLDDLGRNDEVIAILNKVIGIANRNRARYPELKSKIKFLYNNAAIAYMYRGNYDSSLSYHFKSLEIREQEKDERAIGTAKNNIGLVYFKLSNFERALEFYQQSLAIKRELKDDTDTEKILINIGLCFVGLERPEEALKSFTEALAECQSDCSEAALEEANYGMGQANLALGNHIQARENFMRSLELSKKKNDTRYWIENLIGLARIEREFKNYDASIDYLSEANELAQQFDYVELLLNIYRESYKTYDAISDYQNASLFQKQYITLKDSIYGSELIRNLAKVQTNYEERENIRTIQEKNENIRLQNELISRQRIQYLFVVLVTVLTVGLASVLVWANRRQQKHNLALSEAKKIIENQNKELTRSNEELDQRVQEKTRDLLTTNETLIQVNEELDNFIYRTSHDIRGPLVTLKGVCNVASLDVKDPLALDYLKRLDLTAEKLNSILTRLLVVNQINHTELEATPIDLKALIDDILVSDRRTAIPPRMKISHQVDQSVSLVSDRYLMRIILENLIDNSVKFYNTSDRIEPFVNIDITTASPGLILVKVEDNGIGIDPAEKNEIFHLFVRASERSETGGIGLYLTRVAAQRLGGEIKLVATSDKGSTFHVFLPADLRPILEKRKQAEEQMKRERAKRDRELQSQREQDAMMNQYLPHNKQKDALAS